MSWESVIEEVRGVERAYRERRERDEARGAAKLVAHALMKAGFFVCLTEFEDEIAIEVGGGTLVLRIKEFEPDDG